MRFQVGAVGREGARPSRTRMGCGARKRTETVPWCLPWLLAAAIKHWRSRPLRLPTRPRWPRYLHRRCSSCSSTSSRRCRGWGRPAREGLGRQRRRPAREPSTAAVDGWVYRSECEEGFRS
ncbi:unnamed protein product [Urochloa humidicola]